MPDEKAPEPERAVESPGQPRGGLRSALDFLLQPGAIETFLGIGLLGVGVWAFVKDQYGDKLNLALLGGFLGIWILGAVLRWILSLWRKTV